MHYCSLLTGAIRLVNTVHLGCEQVTKESRGNVIQYSAYMLYISYVRLPFFDTYVIDLGGAHRVAQDIDLRGLRYAY